jgi:hypothetical protein
MFGLNKYFLIGTAALALFAGVQTWRLDRVKTESATKSAALLEAAGRLRAASEAIKGRDALLISNGAQEASDAGELAAMSKGSTRAAFDAGRASVRCDGEPVRVRDLRELWKAGAYNPAASGSPSGEPMRPD